MSSHVRKHVLIVEDSPTQAERLRLTLTSAGLGVSVTGTAEEARFKMEDEKPDALLLDLHLPGTSGAALCESLKKDPEFEELPIVLMTGHRDPVSLLRGLEAGADYFMTKDRSGAQIVDHVHRVLNKGAWSRLDAEEEESVTSLFHGETFEFTTGKRQFVEVLFSAFEDLRELSDELRRRKDQAEATLSGVLDLVPVGLIVTDDRGEVELLNEVAREMLETDANPPVEQWPEAFGLRGANQPLALEELPTWQTTHDGEPRREVEIYVCRDVEGGDCVELPVLVNTRVVEDDLGELDRVVTSLTSISERKRAERLRQQLIHADRLAAVGQLAAGVAHEVNNPAAYVMGNLSAMQRYYLKDVAGFRRELATRVDEDEGSLDADEVSQLLGQYEVDDAIQEIADVVDESLEGMERIKNIVSELRTFTRREDNPDDTADIEEVLRTAVKMIERQISYRASLVRDIEPTPRVKADPGKLVQVIMNLLINAADAFESDSSSENTIVLRTRSDEEWVCLSVEDDGRGIAEEVRDRVFEPFFTTKPEGKGTGLGLPICREIVEMSGGSIEIESAVGEGTRVEIRLPVD